MVKNPPTYAGDLALFPGLGRSSGEGYGNPLQYPCMGNSMDREVWWATSPWGHKELDTTEQLTHTHTHTHMTVPTGSWSECMKKINTCLDIGHYHHQGVYTSLLHLIHATVLGIRQKLFHFLQMRKLMS